ncbi:uncharacterized protein LOC108047182 [Drosophila rhopaloa]|uniref:Uncharacterized protein LOC108047182 n=1 Tax=Drosophila rhopaloa TaxID=1041015 RepID=A0A6P4EXB4_DRORH|nr:uncharacterized protein LOC108047182 [Drosophila rhopaloa]
MGMKFVVTTCLIIILIGLVLAQKNVICGNEAIVDGDCEQRIKGFTYIPEKNRCKKMRTKGCTVTGNYFRSRDECESVCKETRGLEKSKVAKRGSQDSATVNSGKKDLEKNEMAPNSWMGIQEFKQMLTSLIKFASNTLNIFMGSTVNYTMN